MENTYPIIIDNGSDTIKAGFAFDDAPRAIFPSIVARPKQQSLMVGVQIDDIIVGQEAARRKGVLKLIQPISRGTIVSYQIAQILWNHCFYNELKITPSCPCLMTCSPGTTDATRSKLTQIMFQTFLVPSFYLSPTSILSIYGAGKTSGLAVEIGYGYSSACPIMEGFSLDYAIEKVSYAGYDIDRFLVKMLSQRSICFTSVQQALFSRILKEKGCKVASNQSQRSEALTISLPDGQLITMQQQRARGGQAIFKPGLMQKQATGVHEMICQSVAKTESDHKKDLFGNIVLSGGTTLMQGIGPRIQAEVEALAINNINKKVFLHPQRQYLSWLGGSILTSLSSFQTMWISQEEYQECGQQIVRRKCY